MFQKGGDHWTNWNAHLVRALAANQRREEGRDERGSWDPNDPWGAEGGRVYSTAMAGLCCEVSARYARVAGAK
jgi:hypothetical protein